MKVRFNRWYNAVLTALMSLIGYGCSSSDDPWGGGLCMYGTPTANYEVNGVVKDEAGAPIKGIKTSLKMFYTLEEGKEYAYTRDSVLTDQSGRYQLKISDSSAYLKLIAEDVDGEDNGGYYQSDTLDIDYKEAVKVKEGDGSWYMGDFTISKDITLKKK